MTGQPHSANLADLFNHTSIFELVNLKKVNFVLQINVWLKNSRNLRKSGLSSPSISKLWTIHVFNLEDQIC
jgi:hypothetical protein